MNKIDIWSLGILSAYLLFPCSGKQPQIVRILHATHIPQEGRTIESLTHSLTSLKAFPDYCDEPTQGTIDHLIWSMLILDPKKRSSAEEALAELNKLLQTIPVDNLPSP